VTSSTTPPNRLLHDVSFDSPPGTVTALVGRRDRGNRPSSASSRRFTNRRRARSAVDGTDLSTVRLDAYRTQLGVVLQDTFLFDGTIRENVAFARLGASEEQVLAACRIARVDEFAEKLDKNYETISASAA